MKFLKSIAYGLVAFACNAGAPANAALVTPTDFQVVEGSGQFTLINNSTDWYVQRLIVQDALAASGAPTTTQIGWLANVTANSFFPASGFSPAFNYFDPTGIADVTKDIGPLSSSSNFFFTTPASVGSPWELYLVNAAGTEVQTLYGVTAAVPEPSTWAMMILGFCGVGFMAYRRTQSGNAVASV